MLISPSSPSCQRPDCPVLTTSPGGPPYRDYEQAPVYTGGTDKALIMSREETMAAIGGLDTRILRQRGREHRGHYS